MAWAAGNALSDKVRAVRIAAADLLLTIPEDQIPPSEFSAWIAAKNESKNYILFHTDFATGDAMAGDYYLKLGDYQNAEKFYRLGLQKDTAMNYARLNLSVVYNLLGQNQQALRVLEEALQIDPGNDRSYFNLALLYNEMKEPGKAKESLSKAIELKTMNPRVYYNYGLMLEQDKNIREAAGIFKKGLALAPTDADLNYALCLLYLQSGQAGEAKKYGEVLKKYYATNPEYQQLFNALGL